MLKKRHTPCVGICSTTYGDLVCRGCKRFAHEITEWNRYDDDQRTQIWDRLAHLREQVVAQIVEVRDRAALHDYAEHRGLAQASDAEQIYAVLTHLAAAGESAGRAGLGRPGETDGMDALVLIRALDSEVYARSIAHYEHSFRVTS